MASDYRGRNKLHFGLRYALHGLKVAIITERNIKIHLIAALLVVLAGVVLHVSVMEWMVLCLTMSAVVSMELMNTALERALDHLEPEKKELIGVAKDMAAAAVLITAVSSVVIACLIFIPKIVAFVS
ncbi:MULTISPECIES: diacylglycerol kinase family protein [Gracilibacillus]|uniref:diacylglycerol kinase family protein n=1 Tax=Gracilibacillus TaxID=74385 RepID=UPI00082643D4|nr:MULTISPECIES: diacylglycerol kinase family protein [Gracilibacillus]